MTAINSNRAIRGPVTAVPVVAGKGVRLVADTENNRWVVEADETVLWTGTENDSGVSTFTLSELSTNFERLRFYGLSYGSTRVQYECPAPTSATEAISIAYNYFCSVTDNNPWQLRAANFTTQDGLTYSYGGMEKFAYGTQTGTAFASSPTGRSVPIYKIVGIGRIANN